MTFPLPLGELLGHWPAYGVYLLIGVAFGAVLEVAGFGNSKILAAQFYFKNMTVLKVMFTAIVVAMVLIFATSALGILDFNLVWVNPTYLWPGIVGGLVMGLGFIIGGFCPGTSVVSAVTGKIDGILFFLGVLTGIFAFGETVGLYEDFWHSSYLGRFTLMDFFGADAGIVVLGVVLMALFMFWGSEQLERIFGGLDPKAAPAWRYGAAAGLAGLAAVVMFVGQPTPADHWKSVAAEEEAALAAREVQVHPGEVLDLIYDPAVRVEMLDVRSETDYNYFHVIDAIHVPLADLEGAVPDLQAQPDNTVFIVMSNDEEAATEAWRALVSYSVPNVYILGGGVNTWIETFNTGEPTIQPTPAVTAGKDTLHYSFAAALGSRYQAAEPDPHKFDELEYEPHVELAIPRGPIGSGCGS
jgi:rhodanese-related sulfurtransferase